MSAIPFTRRWFAPLECRSDVWRYTKFVGVRGRSSFAKLLPFGGTPSPFLRKCSFYTDLKSFVFSSSLQVFIASHLQRLNSVSVQCLRPPNGSSLLHSTT